MAKRSGGVWKMPGSGGTRAGSPGVLQYRVGSECVQSTSC